VRPKRSLPIFVGYAVAALLVLGFLARGMGGEFFLAKVYHVKAVFATASQLVAGDDVTIAGLRVGKIETLSPALEGGAEASMLIHSEDLPIYTDARAVVHTKNLLGETYVELSRGVGGQNAPDGFRIPIEHTLTPVELNQVLDALDPGVRDHLVLAVNSLGAGLAGNGSNLNQQAGDFKALASDLRTIASSIAQNAQHVDRLIISLAKILNTLAQFHAEFRALVTDWDRLMKALLERESDLQGTFRGQDRVMQIFDATLSGQSPSDINQALAEAPAALDNANHYLDDSKIVFDQLNPVVPEMNTTFQRLASAFSAYDTNGDHYWRVYCAGNSQPVSGVLPGGLPGPVPSPIGGVIDNINKLAIPCFSTTGIH
jgi:phospholipid/cholesterol/gamma-HCH transport system substrate-binding protein